MIEGDRPRRVPGLRREEVADLAGLSVDYYTQLERGDLDGASDNVLNGVARALRLDDAERLHLFDLARAGVAARLAPSHGVIGHELQRTLDAFSGMALVRNRRWDYLAANPLGRAVYEDMFDGRTNPPNQVRYVFLDERARDFFDDWPRVAHDSAQILRSEAGRDPSDTGPAELIAEMTEASAEFRHVWSKHDVRLPATGTHRFNHRRVGLLELVVVSAVLRADPALTLLLATPEPGSASETALRELRVCHVLLNLGARRHRSAVQRVPDSAPILEAASALDWMRPVADDQASIAQDAGHAGRPSPSASTL